MLQPRTILVATDFGELGDKALAYGKELARHFTSALHIAHVIEGPFTSVPIEGYVSSLPEFSEQLRKSAAQRLARQLDERETRELRPVLAVLTGRPADEIVRYAQERGVDLIVMGTHGSGALVHLFLGSVAERVVRIAGCPVLTLHTVERDFASTDDAARPSAAARA